MQEGMGRKSDGDSRDLRVGVQGFVKATVENSPVLSHLGSLTHKSYKTCFHRGLQRLHSK